MASSKASKSAVAVLLLLLASCSREPAERASLTSPGRTTSSDRAVSRISSGAPNPVPAGAETSVESDGSGVAVVELFTSEGCSSCPPADRALATLNAQAKARALPVYTLSFHVDYWNYLGWRDRFSRSSYSQRQHGYASIRADSGTYTPQVVVNGEAECVGSDASRIADLVDVALKNAPRTRIEITARRVERAIAVDYRVSGETAGRVLNLALLEPRAESRVERGENAGERLVHVNVVRAFTSRSLSEGTAGHFVFPPDGEFMAGRVGVVAYAEGATQRNISGAKAIELP